MRLDPLVMTTKFTISSMEKMIAPTTTSPPIRKLPKAATTWPAAYGPSLPCDRISRAVATFSDSRRIVVNSSNVGRLEKSSGRSSDSEISRIRIDAMNERASAISNRKVGMGMIRIESWNSTHSANPMSPPGISRLYGPKALSREFQSEPTRFAPSERPRVGCRCVSGRCDVGRFPSSAPVLGGTSIPCAE